MAGSSLFADIKTPYINEVTLKRIASAQVKQNIFQGIITRPNEAVTEKFSNDTDAAEIQVLRVIPNDGEFRRIGADINGQYFNGENANTSATEAYGIRILDTYDRNIDIPTNTQDMISVDLAEQELKNLSGKVDKNINAATIAAQLNALMQLNISQGYTAGIITLPSNPAGEDYKDAMLDAATVLDDGNEAEGIDAYPTEERAYIIKPQFKNYLLKTGALIIGGSNYAQDILKFGGVDSDTKMNIVNGFVGMVGNIPVYIASKPIWSKAAQYLGGNKGSFNEVMGICVAAIGTGRALAFNATMKTIASPQGQGVRLQPKYRFGVACWDGVSVVAIVTNNFVSPFTADSTLMPPASRAFFTVTLDPNTGTGTQLPVMAGADFKVAMPPCLFTPPAGNVFDKWGTTAGGGTFYTVGQLVEFTADTTIYATWKAAPANARTKTPANEAN